MTNKMAIIGLGIMGRRMLENALHHPAFEICGVWGPFACIRGQNAGDGP